MQHLKSNVTYVTLATISHECHAPQDAHNNIGGARGGHAVAPIRRGGRAQGAHSVRQRAYGHGKKVLVQRATKNPFNVIVAPPGPYTHVEVSMKFKPISGREDASGGVVFRFNDGKYYVVRANALEDNFRLYSYDRGRRQIATASVKTPALGQWHTVRLVALGDHMQAWLDGTLYLDHRDARFKSGRVGLWTKADSITAFDDLTIRDLA
jgi:3-keto-disaccharide hydrolase